MYCDILCTVCVMLCSLCRCSTGIWHGMSCTECTNAWVGLNTSSSHFWCSSWRSSFSTSAVGPNADSTPCTVMGPRLLRRTCSMWETSCGETWCSIAGRKGILSSSTTIAFLTVDRYACCKVQLRDHSYTVYLPTFVVYIHTCALECVCLFVCVHSPTVDRGRWLSLGLSPTCGQASSEQVTD